jgi:uncharacterized domain HDIG
MRKIIIFLGKHFQIVYRLFLFIASTALLVYLFPREGSFPYEFQKGKPWLHADLYSTFDFPLRKSNREINFEKDSILKEFKPYYNYQKEIPHEQEAKLNKAFDVLWAKYAGGRGKSVIPDDMALAFKNADSLTKSNYLVILDTLLQNVYDIGIIQFAEQIGQLPSKDFTLVVIRDNVGEEFDFSDVFTQKLAYEFIVNKLNKSRGNAKFDHVIYKSGFFKDLNLNTFLIPNLIYNEDASKNVKDEMIKKISLTKGMFLSDRKIVGKGEIVNEEKYNVLMSLKYEYENKLGHSEKLIYILAGQVLIVGSLLILLMVFVVSFRREIYQNNMRFTFILLLIIIEVGGSSLVAGRDLFNLYIIPFSLLPIIIRTFYDARLALSIHTIAILLVGFLAPNGFEFVFFNFSAGAIAIISLTNLYRRGKLFNTALYVFLTYSSLYLAMFLIQGNDFSKLTEQYFIYFAVSSFLLLMAYPLIFVFEKMFGFLSDMTLMELSDTNQPLLRKLSEKAPGTFQHSLQVANLAEEAAIKVGANPLLVRVGALYHDLGKIYNPMFFIENLSTEKNPHSALSNETSARVIIEHVMRGVEIAQKHRLPDQIVDFIRTHHGASTVQFFYRSYLKKHPEEDVDKSKFTYPGPIPHSKEMALVMMADSVEAASRSLREINQNTINDLVDNIIYYQMVNEQYNNSNITYKDIGMVKTIFKRKLLNIYHVRVEYPQGT